MAETQTITWKTRFERKDNRVYIHIQIVFEECPKTGCSGTLSTSETIVGYTEGGKNFVRTPQELWKTGVPLSCSNCDVSILSPFEIVETLTFQAEAIVKIKRGFQTFRSFNVN